MANPDRVSAALEVAPLSAYRISAIFLCVLVAVIDGFDYVAIGVAAPLLTADLGLSVSQLGAVLALTQIGAAFGALALGRAADVFGRKSIIVLSLALIAAFTALTPFVQSFEALLFVRFLAGIALAGVLAPAIALASELAPVRRQAALVGVVVAGLPMGAAIGSFAGGGLAEAYGWRSIFLLGASLACVLAFVVNYALPESPRVLALIDNTGERIAATMRRLTPGVDTTRLWEPLPRAASSVSAVDDSGSFNALFAPHFARASFMLIILLFCSGVLSNVMLAWMPTLLTQSGVDFGFAARVVGAVNVGSVIGMVAAGRALEIFGTRTTLGVAFCAAAVATLGLGWQSEGWGSLAAGAALGVFLGATTSAGYALASIIYPAQIRSTGVGLGTAALRVGTVCAPLIMPVLIGVGASKEWTLSLLAVLPLLAGLLAANFRNARDASAVAA